MCDAIQFDGVYCELAWFNNHSKVFNLSCGEGALFKFKVKIKLNHALQDSFSAFCVGGCIGGIDEEVIHVDDEPAFCNHIVERVVHELLEGGREIG